MKLLFALLIAMISLISGASEASQQLNKNEIQTLLEGVDYRSLRLSPTGEYVALIQGVAPNTRLVVLDRETLQPTVSVDYEDKGIASFRWFDDDRLYYRISRESGLLEANFGTVELFILSADGEKNYRIWSGFGFEDNQKGLGKKTWGWLSPLVVDEENSDKWTAFIRPYQRQDGAGTGGVYRVEVDNGDTRRLFNVPANTQSVYSNKDGSLFVAEVLDRSYGTTFHVKRGSGIDEFEEFELPEFTAGGSFRALGLEASKFYAVGQKSKEPNASQHIMVYDFSSNEWAHLADIGFAVLSDLVIEGDGALSAYQYVDTKPNTVVLKKTKRAQVLSALQKAYSGLEVVEVSVTDDERLALYHVGGGETLGEYLLFDFETKRAESLLSLDGRFSNFVFSELEGIQYTASDGVSLQGWYSAPKGIDKPPLVVYIHGGPHGPYEQFGFNTRYHLLNQMGYAVFAPNFRGSGGFGVNFEESGYGKWGTRMIDDMADGVKYLIEQGRIDGDRVCTFGGSYGGYASTQSVVRYNDLYKCAVIIAGIFDMAQQKKTTDTGGWYAGDAYMDKALGDEAAQLRSQSPIYNLDQINASLLIHHGTRDERTPFVGAKDFVKALKKTNIDFEYKWYKNEGHGNRNMQNRVDEWVRIQKFLGKHLAADS